MKRTPRKELLENVRPVVERARLFKLPLGDPILEADSRETYSHLSEDIIAPALDVAKACFLFPPKTGISQSLLGFFEPSKTRRGLYVLKEGSADRLKASRAVWDLDSDERGEVCFLVPASSTATDKIYAGCYVPTGFLNIGTVLSRQAVEFARKVTADETVLCLFYSQIGSERRMFVFGAAGIIYAEWLRALGVAKCNERMEKQFFSDTN